MFIVFLQFVLLLITVLLSTLQTVSQRESAVERLGRLKEDRSIIENHCETLDREKSLPVHTAAAEEVSHVHARTGSQFISAYLPMCHL